MIAVIAITATHLGSKPAVEVRSERPDLEGPDALLQTAAARKRTSAPPYDPRGACPSPPRNPPPQLPGPPSSDRFPNPPLESAARPPAPNSYY